MLVALCVVVLGGAVARAEYSTEASDAIKKEELKKEELKKKLEKKELTVEEQKRVEEIKAKIESIRVQMVSLEKEMMTLKKELAGYNGVVFDVKEKEKIEKEKIKAQFFKDDLVVGSRGEQVKALQEILIKKGFLSEGNSTGYFGMMTKEAVRKFQMEKGIDPVGMIGPMTREKLNAYAY